MSFGGGRPMGGILGGDFNDPRTQGILGLSGGLLAGGGPSVGRPISIGQALGMGLNQGQTAFNAAQQRADRLAQIKRQEERQARQDERQKRLDEQAALRNRFQVVGGSILDLSDPSNPVPVYEGAKDPKVSLLQDGAIIATEIDGKVEFEKSPYYDDIMAAKKTSTAPNLSEAQKAVDKDFAKDYQELVIQGGIADVNKGLSQLDEAINILDTEGGTGPIEGSLPDFAASFFNKSGLRAKELVSEVVQRNLRLVLGAQFTEKEGERLINRAFNPRLSEAENIKRIKRLAESIRKARDAKIAAARHYEEFGTLANYKGAANISLDDIEADAGLSEDFEYEETE